MFLAAFEQSACTSRDGGRGNAWAVFAGGKMATHDDAGVYINDAEDGLIHDYDVWLEKLAPQAPTSQYQHNRTGEDNADAHMKRQIMGREVVVAITRGQLDLGPWEQIFYGEFDGRRRKRVLVKSIGD
jgi:secondary thiamine-phosphate synthase enzyme